MAIRFIGDNMFYIIVISLLFLSDQISKFFTVKYLQVYESISIIRGFLDFTHVRNTGGPWSVFDSFPYIFVIMTILVFALGIFYLRKNPPKHSLEKISICLIAGGALGNFADRIFRGYVVDMIDVNLFNYPVFNIADCFIVIGAILLCIYILFFDKDLKK